MKPRVSHRRLCRTLLALCLSAGLLRSGVAQESGGAGRPTYEAAGAGARLRLVAGKSVSISVPRAIERISVAAPETADVITISQQELLVVGKAPGVTSLIIWDRGGRRSIFHLLVQADAEDLERRIQELYPEESLKVKALKDAILISGVTAREEVKKSVGQVAEAFAPKKVVNLIQVEAVPEQVSLKVRIAEVGRSALRELGIGFLARGRLGSEPGQLGVFPGKPLFTPQGNFSDGTGPDLSFGGLVNFFISDSAQKLGLFLRALESRGELRTLAEPRLVTRSGQKASFLAGGEFPIPVPQAGAGVAVTIEFKPFGVRLDFTPRVLGKDRIELKLAPEVSELDFTNSVSVGGFNVPSLTKRRAETQVELRNGQTFAVAGLIQNRMVKDVNKIPWISEIPILGQLFTSPRFNREETELLVLITPEIVKRAQTDDPMPLRPGAGLGRGM